MCLKMYLQYDLLPLKYASFLAGLWLIYVACMNDHEILYCSNRTYKDYTS